MKEIRNYVNNLCMVNCCCRMWKVVGGSLYFKVPFENQVIHIFKSESNKKFTSTV